MTSDEPRPARRDVPTSPDGRVPGGVLDDTRPSPLGPASRRLAALAGRAPAPSAVLPTQALPPAIETLAGAGAGAAPSGSSDVEESSSRRPSGDAARTSTGSSTATAPRGRSSGGRRRDSGLTPSTFALGVAVGLAATTFGPGLLHDAQRVLAPVVHRVAWLDAAVGGVVRAPVVPPPGLEEAADPIGSPPSLDHVDRSFAYLQTQADGRTPVAWSPCRPVHYVVRPDGEPPGGRAVVAEAFERLGAATGLVFVADGETTEPPSPDRAAYLPDRYGDRWAPVLVTWSDEAEDPRLVGGVAGVAGPVALEAAGRPSVAVSGSVSLDAAQLGVMLDEPDGDAMARAVVMHELAHVVGLGHVDDPSELMSPTTDPAVTDFQAGDLTGLALLGGGPCAPWL